MDGTNELERQLEELRDRVRRDALERTNWIRANLKKAMKEAGKSPGWISSLTGIAPNTVRSFLHSQRPTDSQLFNVVLMARALGLNLGDLEGRPGNQAGSK